jgi:hypothetical protein
MYEKPTTSIGTMETLKDKIRRKRWGEAIKPEKEAERRSCPGDHFMGKKGR